MARKHRKGRPVTAARVALAACRELVKSQREEGRGRLVRAVVLARFAVAMTS